MISRRIYQLDPHDPSEPFPDPALALPQPNGLLAIGGCLSPTRLLNAYQAGIFPWYDPEQPILWWSPDPRTVFATNSIHISRRLQREIRHAEYAVTLDCAFAEVLAGCAAPRAEEHGTWLGEDMRAAFTELHQLGHAHSVEIWRDGRLAGGLYGVATGGVFFGESMFSAQRNASKLALVHLADQLAAWGFTLLDGQVGSAHLYRMGAFDLPRSAFVDLLAHERLRPAPPGRWHFEMTVPDNRRHRPAESPGV